jgi:hypothetical protein
MTPKKTKTCFLTTRVTWAVRQQRLTKSAEYGKPSEVLREFIEAFIEDRLTIKPPVKVKGKLYVD